MLTPPINLPAFALIIRAMGGDGAEDQRACLSEMHRRGLWLSPEQSAAAIARAGLQVPEDIEGLRRVLTDLGYRATP